MEPATEVMTLGRVGALAPQWRMQYLNPPASTRQVPQNRLRQTINGPRSGVFSRQLRRVSRRPLFGAIVPTGDVMQQTQASRMHDAVFAPGINMNLLKRGALAGLARAGRIALGAVEVNSEGGLLSSEEIDASLDLTGEALDAQFTPEQIAQIEQTRVMDAEAAASATDTERLGPAIRIGRNTAIGWGVLATLSLGASIYHGYRRNNSLGWALVWGLSGAVFPIVTPAVALAQGFGKRKGR